MCVSFLKSPDPVTPPKSVPGDREALSNIKIDREWILGCLYLLSGVTVFACNTVLQVQTLRTLIGTSHSLVILLVLELIGITEN
jgi:hypothetical protein